MYVRPQDVSEKLHEMTNGKIPLKIDDLVNKNEVSQFMGDDT